MFSPAKHNFNGCASDQGKIVFIQRKFTHILLLISVHLISFLPSFCTGQCDKGVQLHAARDNLNPSGSFCRSIVVERFGRQVECTLGLQREYERLKYDNGRLWENALQLRQYSDVLRVERGKLKVCDVTAARDDGVCDVTAARDDDVGDVTAARDGGACDVTLAPCDR